MATGEGTDGIIKPMGERIPVAIIMCVCNAGESIKHAIRSIVNITTHPYRLIIVESESTDGTAEVCDIWAKQYKQIEVHHTKKEGYVKAMNYGIKAAGDLDVYITQADVIIHKLYKRDWLEALVEISNLEYNGQKVGLVTTLGGTGVSGPKYLNNFRWFGTWSLFIPRRVINEIGVFDEAFSPGAGDDIDYTYRVHLAGLILLETDFWVEHHRTGEHYAEGEEMKDAHAEIFRRKHKLGEFATMQGGLK